HTMVEPCAAEHEFAEPVDERLALDEGNPLPVSNQIVAETAAGPLDQTVRGQLDQVGRLVVVELVPFEEAELDGGCGHALLEVLSVEAEAIAEELDDVFLARPVVG